MKHHNGVADVVLSTPFWRMASPHHFGASCGMPSANNIELLRKQRGWSRPELARQMGTSPQQIERLEKGTRRLAKDWIDKAASAFGVPPPAIIASGDDSKVFLTVANASPVRMEGASEQRMLDDLPVYGTALGAERQIDGEAIEQTTLNRSDVIQYVKRPVLLNGRADAYGLWVSGSSMSPRFEDGEMIIVDPKGRLRIGDDVVVYLRPDGEADDGESARAVLVKRLVRRSASHIELRQYEPPLTFRISTTDIVRVDRVLTLQEMLT